MNITILFPYIYYTIHNDFYPIVQLKITRKPSDLTKNIPDAHYMNRIQLWPTMNRKNLCLIIFIQQSVYIYKIH